MRKAIIGPLVAVFGPMALLVAERIVSSGPSWVWGLMAAGSAVAGCAIFLLADRAHQLWSPIARRRPLMAMAVGLISAVIVGGSAWLVTIATIESDARPALVAVPAIIQTPPSPPTADEIAEAIVKRQPPVPPVEPAKAIPSPSSDRLFVYTQYAYEWSNYLGATNAPLNEGRELFPGAPLKKQFGNGQHALALGVGNRNDQPVKDVRLIVTFPVDVTGVEYEHPDCERIQWTRNFGWTYMYRFTAIDSGSGLHACPQFQVTFPGPDTYEIQYTIKPFGIDGKTGSFAVVLE